MCHLRLPQLYQEQEISTLKQEKTNNEQLLQNTQTKYTDTTDKRAKLEPKKRDTQTELANTEKTLETTKSELQSESEKNTKLTVEISSVVQAAELKMKEVEKKADAERDLIRKTKGERMALEYLIKRNHIEFNEIKVINSLDGRTNTDMTTVSKVTGLSEALIAKTLEGLEKRNLLTYDDSTGAITVTGSLKL